MLTFARHAIMFSAVFALGSRAAAAQDAAPPTDTLLVLDASGSMWGQIDGVNKIVIARDVVEGLVLETSTTTRCCSLRSAGSTCRGGSRPSVRVEGFVSVEGPTVQTRATPPTTPRH